MNYTIRAMTEGDNLMSLFEIEKVFGVFLTFIVPLRFRS